MLETTAAQASKPPPIPGPVAEHAKPAPPSQSLPPSQWVNLNLIIPDLSIKQWSSRLFKLGLAATLVYIALLIPLVIIKALEKYLESPARPF